jgi:hypothetical protein
MIPLLAMLVMALAGPASDGHDDNGGSLPSCSNAVIARVVKRLYAG